jgi:hypothetical protein
MMYVIIDTGACCHYVLLGGLFSSYDKAEAYREEFVRIDYAWRSSTSQTFAEFAAACRLSLAIQELEMDPQVKTTTSLTGTVGPDCQIWPQ